MADYCIQQLKEVQFNNKKLETFNMIMSFKDIYVIHVLIFYREGAYFNFGRKKYLILKGMLHDIL